MTQQHWNSTLYDDQHAFVWQYGESLIEWLAPQQGEHILDLGCGTGHLTARIAECGAVVSGIDADPTMIAKAQHTYPQFTFTIADARSFQVPEPLDAVFSNATLHWIREPDAAIACIHRSLKSGGRLVAEFGGKGNVGAIVTALFLALEELGYADCEPWNPWYYPSIGEYAVRLEQQGFEVSQAVLFDRPTPLQEREAGLRNWLSMFANGILAHVSPEEQLQVIQRVEAQLRPKLYRDGQWTADYRRLRILAYKE